MYSVLSSGQMEWMDHLYCLFRTVLYLPHSGFTIFVCFVIIQSKHEKDNTWSVHPRSPALPSSTATPEYSTAPRTTGTKHSLWYFYYLLAIIKAIRSRDSINYFILLLVMSTIHTVLLYSVPVTCPLASSGFRCHTRWCRHRSPSSSYVIMPAQFPH